MVSGARFCIGIFLFLSCLITADAQREPSMPPIQGDVFSTNSNDRECCRGRSQELRDNLERWYQNEQETIREWEGFANDSYQEGKERAQRARSSQALRNAQTIYQQNLADIKIYRQKADKLYRCVLAWIEQCCKGRLQCDTRNYGDEYNTNSGNTTPELPSNKNQTPRQDRNRNQTPPSNQKPNKTPPNLCHCKAPQISGAATTSIERITNLQEIAEFIFERYDTGNPIGIIKIKSSDNRPSYLIVLAGTEYVASVENAQTLLQDAAEEAGGRWSAYRRAVFDAIRNDPRIRNARLIIAGHSLGGMVAQNIVLDNQLNKFQLQVEEIITFGSPVIAPRADGTKYVYVEHVGDLVLSRLRNHNFLLLRERQINIGGDFKKVSISGGPARPDFLWGHHGTYNTNDALKDYDVHGQEHGKIGRDIEPNSFLSFAAPRNPRVPVIDSESIGEEMMNKWATEKLGYQVLLSPAKASNYRQGFDGIYWDPKLCAIVIGEAKGGYNGKTVDEILKPGYGYKQGTIEWARAAAQRITRSHITYDNEVRLAEMVLCVIGAFNTRHTVGERNKAVKEKTVEPFRSELCKQIRECKASVRVELFHTKIKNGRAEPIPDHRILDQYPR